MTEPGWDIMLSSRITMFAKRIFSTKLRRFVSLLLSVLVHGCIIWFLTFYPLDRSADDGIALMAQWTEEVQAPVKLEPIDVDVQEEIPEVETPHVQVDSQLDQVAGASGAFSNRVVSFTSPLERMPGLSAVGDGLGSGEGERGLGDGVGGTGLKQRTFEELVEELRNGLDLIIVFDSTSSMGAEIQTLKLRIFHLGQALLRVLPETRIAFVTYKDIGDVPEYAYSELTSDIHRLHRFLANVEAYGGGFDIEEAVDLGLEQAIKGYEFRKDAHKVIVLFGDAPPRQDALPRILPMANSFKQQSSARLNTVTLRTNLPLPTFTAIAHFGGGESIVLNSHHQILQELFLLVFGRENRARAMEFLKLDGSTE